MHGCAHRLREPRRLLRRLNVQPTAEAAAQIGRSHLNVGLVQARHGRYIPPYSLVALGGDDGYHRTIRPHVHQRRLWLEVGMDGKRGAIIGRHRGRRAKDAGRIPLLLDGVTRLCVVKIVQSVYVGLLPQSPLIPLHRQTAGGIDSLLAGVGHDTCKTRFHIHHHFDHAGHVGHARFIHRNHFGFDCRRPGNGPIEHSRHAHIVAIGRLPR